MMTLFSAWGLMGLLAMVEFTERPVTDFDTVIQALAPHGQWAPHAVHQFVFQPKAAEDPRWSPYREGQWIYTDYGWTWRGAQPGAWATDHYGYWSKPEGGRWVWVPGKEWLGGCVEWVQSGPYVGWRPGQLDRFSNSLEPESERFRDASQWNFIKRADLRGPLTAANYVNTEETKRLLLQSQPMDHVFTTYREIERPGPPPDLFADENGKLPTFPVIRELQEPDAVADAAIRNSCFAYRPRFHQDADGILRRVDLFLNPRKENPEYQAVKETLAPDRELTPKEKKAMESAAERERLNKKHQEDLYR
jgi:hypothetical protein